MKKVLCNILCAVLSALSITGGCALMGAGLPEQAVWRLAGITLIVTGAAAILSMLAGLFKAERKNVYEAKAKGVYAEA